MSETTENNDKTTDGNGNKVSHIPNVNSSESVKKTQSGVKETKIKFCNEECRFLSMSESEQNKTPYTYGIHVCNKYNKRVLHLQFHPDLVRLDECDEP